MGAGQTLQVTTAVTGSCDQSMFYAVRVDLVDGRSSKVLSSVVFPYVPVTAGFTVLINNSATAPTTLGPWVLQVNAYLIASMNGGVVASAHQLFNVVVVPYTAPTTTTIPEQITTNSTTTLSLMSANSTSQITSIGETSFTSTSPAASENINQTSSSTLATVAAILVVLAAIVIVIISRRKRTPQRPLPQQSANVKYCEHCGTQLKAADEFCGHCGTKQA